MCSLPLLLAPQENSGEPPRAGWSGLGQKKNNLVEFAFFVKLVPCAPLTDLGTDGRASWRSVGVSFLSTFDTWWYIVSMFVRVQVGAGMSKDAECSSLRSICVLALHLFGFLTCV